MQCAEIESAIESIGEGREVLSGVPSEVECMVTPAQAGLEVAQHGVDPLELGQILRLSSGNNGWLMNASGRSDGSEADEPIGVHSTAVGQTGLGPLCDSLEAKARDGGELDAQRMAAIAERDGGDERHLVLRAPACLAAAPLTTEVGVIDLNRATDDIALLACGHRPHQLVVDQLGSGVAHPQLSHERERRQACFGLADEVNREKPNAQGQFGALHHGAGDQRGLMPAGLALKQRVGSSAHPGVSGPIAARTMEPDRPARLLQCHSTLGVGTVKLEKRGHRQSGLKLDSIHCHHSTSRQMCCICIQHRS